jgi:hydrogenase expression/formation protein HypC
MSLAGHRTQRTNEKRASMCLGIPGKVVETYDQDGLWMGKVDFGGVRKQVCFEHTANALPGQYVIVHVGFALHVIDEQEAVQIFSFLAKMNELSELGELSTSTPQTPYDPQSLKPAKSPLAS